MALYKEPETLDMCEERIAKLIGEETALLAQINDPMTRRQLSAYDYDHWQSDANKQRARVIQERKLLEAWRSRTLRAEADRRRAAKETKRQQAELRDARIGTDAQTYSDVVQLVRRLVGALERTSVELPERDMRTLQVAYTFLNSVEGTQV